MLYSIRYSWNSFELILSFLFFYVVLSTTFLAFKNLIFHDINQLQPGVMP